MKKLIMCLAFINTFVHSKLSIKSPLQDPTDMFVYLERHYLPESPIILEAGAFNGRDTKKMSLFFKKGHLHSFEPYSESFVLLQNTTKNFPNVTLYPMGLGRETGQVPLYICDYKQKIHDKPSPTAGASSILPPSDLILNYFGFKSEPVFIELTTIDDWALQNDIPRIDFMWLDMEGYELYALEGASHMLSTVKAIYIEVNCKEVRKNIPLYPRVKDFLNNKGFEEIGIWHMWHPQEGAWQGNALFVRG